MKISVLMFLIFFVLACRPEKKEKLSFYWENKNPKPPEALNYKMDSKRLVIQNATIITAAGKTIKNGSLVLEKGLIKSIHTKKIKVKKGVHVIDGTGKIVTPGLIDVHSHMGVYASPSVKGLSDGNEVNGPVSSNVWAEHGFWPQDPDIWRALAGGVTTVQILHGSANLIGGRSFTAKLLPKTGARQMRFKDAPQGVKLACGENPKRVYKKSKPNTRMGNMAGWRKSFQEAIEYERGWAKAREKKSGKLPKRDLSKETLVKILKGELLVHWHCYKADDINNILDVAKEFKFKVRTIHHGLEAYKVANRLKSEVVSVASWADWYGFKQEAYDAVPHNLALIHNAGARSIIHSDSAVDIRFLNVEAAKAMMAGRKLGINLSEDEIFKWITLNPAWALGLDDKIGSIEVGKMADLVIWDGHPFSIKAKTDYVLINGKVIFNREKGIHPLSDLEVGITDGALNDGRGFSVTEAPKRLLYPELGSRKEMNQKKLGKHFLIEHVNYFQKNKWIRDTSVEIFEGKILSVGKNIEKKKLEILDAKGKFLVPGFIESLSDLGLTEIDMESSANDHGVNLKGKPTPGVYALDSLDMNNTRIPIVRSEGVTTAITVHRGPIVMGHGVAFDLNEKKRFIKSPVALFGNLGKVYGNQSRSLKWRKLRRLVTESISYIENKKSYGVNGMQKLFTSHQDLEAMLPVLKGMIPWVIQAQRASDIERVVAFKKFILERGYKVKIVIAGGSEAWLTADLLRKNDIAVMMSPTAQTPLNYSQLRARFDQAAFLDDKGVKLVISAGMSGSHAGRLRQEAGMAVKYGLSYEKALKAITETPQELFGLSQNQNLVLWSGDPLEPTSWVERIWIRGESVSIDNRQSKLAKKYFNSVVK